MELLLQQLINGIALGSLYAIFAIGFGLMFANLGLLNVAFGSIAVVGALAGYWGMSRLSVGWPVAVLVAMAGAAVLALVVDRVAFQPLRNRGRGSLAPIISSIAVWMIIDAVVLRLTDSQPRSFPLRHLPNGSLNLGPLSIPWSQAIMIIAAVVVTAAFYVFMQRSRFGMAMRASGYELRSAVIVGVRPQAVIVTTTLMAGGVAGLAGVLGAMSSNSISLALGQGLFLKGFAAVIVGGYGDIRGAALGGLLIGLVEVMSAQYISNSFRDVVVMGLLVVILLVRPQGILGTREAQVRA